MPALSSIINSNVQSHGFERILIIVRVSPASQAREDDSMSAFLARQAKSLTNVCSTISAPVHHLKAPHISDDHGGFVKMLEERECVKCIQIRRRPSSSEEVPDQRLFKFRAQLRYDWVELQRPQDFKQKKKH